MNSFVTKSEGLGRGTAQKTSFLGRFKKDVNPLRQSRISKKNKKNWAREVGVGTLVCLSVRCVCHLIFDFCSLDKEEVYLQCNESGHEQTESGLRFHPPLWAVKTNWVTLIYHLRETIFLPWFRSAQHHSPSRYVASARARKKFRAACNMTAKCQCSTNSAICVCQTPEKWNIMFGRANLKRST